MNFSIAVALAKYLDHLPLERQVRAMLRDGLVIDSQTLFDQCQAIATKLKAAYEKLHAHLLVQRGLGADETRWPVHGEKEKASKWHAWVLASDDAVYYEVHDTRGAEAARKILGSFRGVLMCDCFSSYVSIAKATAGVRLAHCWAHYPEPPVIPSGDRALGDRGGPFTGGSPDNVGRYNDDRNARRPGFGRHGTRPRRPGVRPARSQKAARASRFISMFEVM